jgi:hypothetical protein
MSYSRCQENRQTRYVHIVNMLVSRVANICIVALIGNVEGTGDKQR